MHSKRLCIDGRAAMECASQGAIAKELIDQLVSAQVTKAENSPVLLSHPEQHFDGEFERFDTRKKIGHTFFYSAWEKNFLETANIDAFHRIRPIDRILGHNPCPTVTTLLPPKKKLPRTLYAGPEHRFVVPSKKDAEFLESRYQVDDSQVIIIPPNARRFVNQIDEFNPSAEGWILVLTDPKYPMEIEKLLSVLADKYPNIPSRVISLTEDKHFSPLEWLRILENTKVCFYLTDAPFDWPYLAMESLFFQIPVVYPDSHRALREHLHHSVFQLSRFLVELPSFDDLATIAVAERAFQTERKAYDPMALAREYRQIYSSIESKDN